MHFLYSTLRKWEIHFELISFRFTSFRRTLQSICLSFHEHCKYVIGFHYYGNYGYFFITLKPICCKNFGWVALNVSRMCKGALKTVERRLHSWRWHLVTTGQSLVPFTWNHRAPLFLKTFGYVWNISGARYCWSLPTRCSTWKAISISYYLELHSTKWACLLRWVQQGLAGIHKQSFKKFKQSCDVLIQNIRVGLFHLFS